MTTELREALDAADKAVDDLCQGRLRWEMRVPAEPDHDPDLIISHALGLARKMLASVTPSEPTLDAAPELRAALDFRDQPVIDAASDIRKSHAPNEWDSCVACRKAWPCDAELLAELVLTRATALSAPSRSRD